MPYIPAEQLLRTLGISQPEEIDIERIAQHCGAAVVYEPLTGCEARIIGYGDRAIITVNSHSPRSRQRFSAGHELGHWMHDRGSISLSCSENQLVTEWFENNPERKANRYAADLLMPVSLFRPQVQDREINFDSVEQLANMFQTSLTATAIRFVEHGPLPSMVICSDAKRRKWFTRSEIIHENLWPHEAPGRETVAFDLHRNAAALPPGPSEVNAAQWINHPKAGQYVLVEDSIRVSGGLVLTLLWWRNEQQLLDLDDEQEEEDAEEQRSPYDID